MTLRIATFNAGLAVGVLPHARERLPHIVSALANLDVDLLFVQEFWLDPHWEELRVAAEARFPHAYRALPAEPPRRGVCSREEVAPLVACARAHCDGLTSDDLARCVVHRCASAATSMSPACLNCVASNPTGSLDEIMAPCLAEADAPQDPASARGASRGGRYGYGVPGLVAYGGSYGTGLLSALPLFDRDELVYEATLNARGALYARVEHRALGDMHVFATHFSPGPHDEQLPQVERLLAWIGDKVGRGGRVILLGDLNTGPSSGLYRRLEAAGFENPYTALPDPPATFPDGSFSSRGMGRSGWLLDHVLLRGFSEPATAERILDEPLTIEAEGQKVRTTYSDHCGILVTVGGR
jgi:endonuclease/exonuclease/phosphatase family metal-dependent hydrolase